MEPRGETVTCLVVLIGAVLYAVSGWLSADAVNIAAHNGQKSPPPAIAPRVPVP